MSNQVPRLNEQQFAFLEAELYSLVSYYDKQRLYIYGLMDAYILLFQRPIEFAIFYHDAKNPTQFIASTVGDPTLHPLLTRQREEDVDRLRDKETGKPSESLIQFISDSPLYIALYEPSFKDGVMHFCLFGEGTAQHTLLNKFIKFVEKNPAQYLLKHAFQGLTKSVWTYWRERQAALAGEGKEKPYPVVSLNILEELLERIYKVIDILYEECARESPLLTYRRKNGNSPIDSPDKFPYENIFFIVRLPQKRSFTDKTGKYEYSYSMRLYIPKVHKEKLIEYLGKQDEKISREYAEKIIEDSQLPFGNERSVLDSGMSSGFLTFCDPLMDSSGWSESQEDEDHSNKNSRNSATKILFGTLYGKENGTKRALIMQNFMIHLGGAPYLMASTITPDTLKECPAESVFGEEQFWWTYNYCFYIGAAKVKLSRKFKRMIKADYMSLVDKIIRYWFSNAASPKELEDQLNSWFAAIAAVYPFTMITWALDPPNKAPHAKPLQECIDLREGAVCISLEAEREKRKDATALRSVYWGKGRKKVYITSHINRRFEAQIPYHHFDYLEQIVKIAERAAQMVMKKV